MSEPSKWLRLGRRFAKSSAQQSSTQTPREEGADMDSGRDNGRAFAEAASVWSRTIPYRRASHHPTLATKGWRLEARTRRRGYFVDRIATVSPGEAPLLL